jgi:hypothetical protein
MPPRAKNSRPRRALGATTSPAQADGETTRRPAAVRHNCTRLADIGSSRLAELADALAANAALERSAWATRLAVDALELAVAAHRLSGDVWAYECEAAS